MNNNLLQQLQTLIKDLEIKLSKPKISLKSKIEILNEINSLNKQYKDLIKAEFESLESKYETINAEKIVDINKQIDKAASRGKFMQDYHYDLRSEVLLTNTNYLNFIDKFWIDIMSNLEPNVNVMVRFLIQMSDTSARTLSRTLIINNDIKSLNSFKEIITENLNNVYSHYLSQDEDNMILGFVMRYKILSNKSNKNTVIKKALDIKKGRIQRTVKIRNINYPLSTNTINFGDIQYKQDNLTFVFNSEKGLKFEFDRSNDSQII